jgi:hypothetical protein
MKAKRAVPVVLLVAAVFAALSCGDGMPTSVSRIEPRGDLTMFGVPLQKLNLVSCTPLPYDSVTEVIGPGGGTIRVGAQALVVPPGALDSEVVITAVAPSDTINAVQFQPAGLHFNVKASLVMSYANCGIVGALLPQNVVYVDSSLNILDVLPSLTDPLSQTVTGSVRHFSEYALAW